MIRYIGWRPGVPLISVVTLVCVFLAGWHLTDRQARETLEQKAASSAHAWLGYFSGTVHDFDILLQTGRPNEAQLQQIRASKNFANVFRFKLFDSNGELTLVSDSMGGDLTTGSQLAEYNPEAYNVLITRTPFIEVKDGHAKPNRPDTYAEIYLPVVVDGASVGVIEVYVDVSAAFVATEKAFAQYAAMLGALLLVALCVPCMHLASSWKRFAKTNAELQIAHSTAETMHQEQEWAALHDALTGLPNRRFNDEEMSWRIASGGPCTVVRIDLDRFKHVNDTLGHEAGDLVLIEVSKILTASITVSDFASRIGGDEFCILLGSDATQQEALDLVGRIQVELAKPLLFGDRPCRYGASFGIAHTDDIDEVGEDIQHFADAALYKSKEAGRNTCTVFTPALHDKIIADRNLALELHAAIEADEFEPYFQPQVSADDGRLVGAEVLMRWRHPLRGILRPGEFMHVAEQLRILADIDRMVMDRTRIVLDGWRGTGLIVPKISFNMSAARLLQQDLIPSVQAMQGPGTSVALELLESILIENEGDVLGFQLDLIREAGIEIEIDDFGSGHASIVGVMAIRPSVLKIDQRIVAPISESGEARRLVGAIIEIADTLGIGTLAEGVETEAQAEILRDLGCDTLQGFFFSQPLDEAQFKAYAQATDLRKTG